jgi:hypothetical protein
MPGRAKATETGRALEQRVIDLATQLGLEPRPRVRVGKRLWGRVRIIDVVLRQDLTRKLLGLECKSQETAGSAEEKIPTVIQDIGAWPIPGIVVFDGAGFSREMRSYLLSTGKAVEFDDLRDWLTLFFAL